MSPVTAKQIKLWTDKNPVLARVKYVRNGWPVCNEETKEDLKPYWRQLV